MTPASIRRRHDSAQKINIPNLIDSDNLDIPLLLKFVEEDEWEEKRRNEKPAWASIFCHIVAKWSNCFGISCLFSQYATCTWRKRKCCSKYFEALACSTIWLRSMLLCGCAHQKSSHDKFVTFDITPIHEECLHKLQRRLEVPFDGSRSGHQDALVALWRIAFPDRDFDGLISEQWKDMGWQGNDPSTDFRGGGFISLENLLFFGKKYKKSFHQLLWKQGGRRATWEYPFAVAGVNITFMLIQMLDLRSPKPSSLMGVKFLKMFAEDETSFDLLYCVAFKVMDELWLAMRASYMEFNAVMKAVRAQLEQEFTMEEVKRIEDLPSYSLLC